MGGVICKEFLQATCSCVSRDIEKVMDMRQIMQAWDTHNGHKKNGNLSCHVAV